MQEFIVSARKYRPMTFDTVVGQHALTTTLKNAISGGKLAHAYLFCGPRGVGKTTCARIFAKAINCLNPQADGDVCGQCESCRAFNEQRSMNIHELDAASNNSVDDIRELISRVQIPPQTGRYKVFIIDEVHMLSAAAFNAFLKTLEEPPAYVIFILATTEKHKILPTILSRCQVYDFARITTQDTVSHLRHVAKQEGCEVDDDALNLIAQKADGGMRDALSIFDQMVSFTSGHITYEQVCKNLNVLQAEHYFNMTECFLNHDVKKCMLLLDGIIRAGFDAGVFIGGLAAHMRDLLMARDPQTIHLMERSEQMKQRYAQQAEQCAPKFLYRAIRLCNDCDRNYRTAGNKRLQVEICLIQVEQLTEDDSPDSGPGPAKTLNPIFRAADAQQTKASTQSEQVPAPESAAQKPVHQVPRDLATLLQRGGNADSGTPRVITGFGPSLRLRNSRTATAFPHTAQVNQEQPKQHTPLDAEKFRITWYEFIQALPREQQAMAQRMRDMKPCVKDADTITLTVNNVQVKQSLETILPQLMAQVRAKLENDYAQMHIDVCEAMQAARRYSKSDLFVRMSKSNPYFRILVRELNLTIE